MTDAYRGLVAKSGKSLARDQILETHDRYEADQEATTPAMPYSELLGVVHSRVARERGVETTADQNIKFGSSVPDWPAFSDSVAELQYLKTYYKLVILPNVDRESFKSRAVSRDAEAFDAIDPGPSWKREIAAPRPAKPSSTPEWDGICEFDHRLT